MITKSADRTPVREPASEGGQKFLQLDHLLAAPAKPEKLRTYAHITLDPGGKVDFHVHNGESESYYILSGTGEYSDNGKIVSVEAGDVTYTPGGEGHGILNTGSVPLEFMALIILD